MYSVMGPDEPADSAKETPEVAKFRSLSPSTQRLLLCELPSLLARAAHEYGSGRDCEQVLREALGGAGCLLGCRNQDGDVPIAVALLSRQDARAAWLMGLAEEVNPAALGLRSGYLETLAMLSTGCPRAGEFIEHLLERDPAQLHRAYDRDGRNLLHHCAMEDSADALRALLGKVGQLLASGVLTVDAVSAALHMNDDLGDTPMHAMAVRNRGDMLRLLGQFCAEAGINIDLDVRRHFGSRWTPLMVAAAAGAAEAARYLLANGADPGMEDQEGRSLPQLAAADPAITELLEPHFNWSELEAAGHCRAAAAAATTRPLDCTSVDSGIQSWPAGLRCPEDGEDDESSPSTPPPPPPPPRSDCDGGLSAVEVVGLEERLNQRGLAAAFLRAMCRLTPSFQSAIPLVQETDRPVVAAFGVWSRSGAVPRCLVDAALKDIGAEFVEEKN